MSQAQRRHKSHLFTRPTWHGRALIAAGLATLGLSACGIPVNSAATPLNSAQAGLVNGTPQIPGTSSKPGSIPFLVYFIRDGLLYPVRRYLNSSTLSVTAEATAALAALSYGPAPKEVRQGITTSLYEVPRANLRLDSIDTKARVARVDLDAEFIPPNLFGTRLAQAYAQIVYTLTSSVFAKQVTSLGFVMNGATWSAYLPNGSFGDSANQHDYAVFNAAQRTTTTRPSVTRRAS